MCVYMYMDVLQRKAGDDCWNHFGRSGYIFTKFEIAVTRASAGGCSDSSAAAAPSGYMVNI